MIVVLRYGPKAMIYYHPAVESCQCASEKWAPQGVVKSKDGGAVSL
jgi:hypothetical protein